MTESIGQSIEKTLEKPFQDFSGKPGALLFTGGFDSMLLAFLMKRCGVVLTAVTVQFDDFNPVTVSQAAYLARKMDISHHILYVSLSDFLSSFRLFPTLADKPILDLDLVVTHAAFKTYDPKVAGKVFVSGMGSDQWFGERDFEQEKIDIETSNRIAEVFGYHIIFPFLSDEIRSLAQGISVEAKKDKKILKNLIPDDYKHFISESNGKREIQVPTQVRQMLLRIHGKQEGVKSVDQALQELMKSLWLKKG